MAETFLFSIAGKILGELSSPAIQRFKLLKEFKTDLEKLENSISTIKAVLLDAEEKKTTNHEVMNWLKKLKAAMEDADDVIDDLSTQVLRYRVVNKVRVFFSSSNQIAFRYKMSRKVREIRERLDDIAADRNKFHFRERMGDDERRAENTRREETDSKVPADGIIGRESDKNAIVERLLNSDFKEDVVVVPIVGIGGLGKTALAKLVYNDEEIKKHFQPRMWVCVSDEFDVKLIAQNIIESATGKRCERIQMDGVKDELGKQIDGKKYLLVLDDVWNENQRKWEKLRELLMGGARGSKILLTTRTQLVAEITSTVSPYLLKGVSEIESWNLFKQVAFKDGVEPESQNMIAIGERIVKKCAGVPLAIRAVGSLLRIKKTEKEWLYFKDDELSKIPQTESDIFPILKLSYDYLPPYLKRCFAYCSMFPKDHVFDKNTLIRLWIAQGFIQVYDETKSLEDVGDGYFMDLLRSSFFQDVIKDEMGNVVGCKMHDLIQDLAQHIAGSESCTIDGDVKCFDRETRHVLVFVYTNVNEFTKKLESFFEANKLRTFMLGTWADKRYISNISKEKMEGIKWSNELISNKIISTFKRLRALKLCWSALNKVPSSISELWHLRYLDLTGNDFELLPECICRLHNLETLILDHCDYLRELPRETKNLVSLRHLEIDCCFGLTRMPHGLGELTSLQTLTKFVVDNRPNGGFSGGLGELDGLINLRGTLMIENLGGAMAETKESCPNHLVKMGFLEELDLHWSYPHDDVHCSHGLLFEGLQPNPNLKKLQMTDYHDLSFPSWMANGIGLNLPNLVEIKLHACVGWQHVAPLGHLPSLRVLTLELMFDMKYIYEEDEEDCDGSGEYVEVLFPSLTTLKLSFCKQLKGLRTRRKKKRETVATEAEELLSTSSYRVMQIFPTLNRLEIHHCPQLFVDRDENITQYLTTLQCLCIDYSPDLMEWIGKLISLQKLEIQSCESMTSLPNWMHNLTILKELILRNCSPKLRQRCSKEGGEDCKEGGEDWPKIAHIPYVFF